MFIMNPSIKKLMENLLEMQKTLLSEQKDLKSTLTNTATNLEKLKSTIKSMDNILQNYKSPFHRKLTFLRTNIRGKNVLLI